MLTQALLAPCLPSACSVASLLCHNNNLIAIEHLARTMHLCVIRCAVDSGRFGDNKVHCCFYPTVVCGGGDGCLAYAKERNVTTCDGRNALV